MLFVASTPWTSRNNHIPPNSYANTVSGCLHAGGRRPCLHGRFSGGTATPFVIPLKLCSLTPILGHHLQRPSDQRVTHAQHRSPDPRQPDSHHRFPERSNLLSAAWVMARPF